MDCFHINWVKYEIGIFHNRINDYNSSIYRKLSEIVNKKDITKKQILVGKSWIGNDYHTVATYPTYDFHYVSDQVIAEFISRISNLLNNCDCYEGNKNKQMTNKKILVADIGTALYKKEGEIK